MLARNCSPITERHRARRILFAQSLLSIISAAIVLPFGVLVARDMLCGGSVAVLGSAVLAYFTSGEYRAARPDAIVRHFYLGQLARFSVIVGAFAIIMLVVSDINPVALLAAFFIVQVLPLVVVNLYDRRAFADQRK